jgi:hypothetical protein
MPITTIGAARVSQRGWIRIMLSVPFIYGMIIPIACIDLAATIYQHVTFRLYGIPRVNRRSYVRFVARGTNLQFLDRMHCRYCSYSNGVAAYFRAVLIETEKYWCPIKYALRKEYHVPHPQEPYAKEGNLKELKNVLSKPPVDG